MVVVAAMDPSQSHNLRMDLAMGGGRSMINLRLSSDLAMGGNLSMAEVNRSTSEDARIPLLPC